MIIKKNTSIKRKIILTMNYTAVAVPTLLVALLAITYYYLGIEQMFSDKITNSINDTVKVATLYLEEHNSNIKTSAFIVSTEIAHNMYELLQDPSKFTAFLDQKAQALGLADIVVFTEDKKVLGHTSLTYSLLFFENIPIDIMHQADQGVIMTQSRMGKVQALLRMDKFMHNLFIGNVYILVSRYMDSEIINHLERTQEHADIFLSVKQEIQNIRQKVITAFIIMLLLFLVMVMLISRKLADFILKPIHELSEAIKRVKLGHKMAKVPEKNNEDEIAILAKSFNKMIDTITSQHDALITTKHIIEDRNLFIEAIMSELSAGVMVLDKNGIIEMSNLSALKILGLAANEILIGKNYINIVPEFKVMVIAVTKKYHSKNIEITSENITITRNNKNIHLLVKIQLLQAYNFDTYTNSFDPDNKIIITVDDITAVVSGQRFKAWADIARRLAHEIKNPLTPIQLAVDRLEHKFLSQIDNQQEVFQKYIQIINNRVEDIKKMLTEFVEFAGISTLKMTQNDLIGIINDVIFLQKHQWPNIQYELENNIGKSKVLCEKTYIIQVMTNLLKNAAEALTSKDFTGVIKITLNKSSNDNEVIVLVEDNGIGISADIMERICEPYVTTKTTGSGLGLSIVNKIIEEHKSDFHIKNGDNGGTIASFSLQLAKKNN